MRSPAAQEVIQKILSSVILAFGLVLSVAWTWLLGYGLVKIVDLARLAATIAWTCLLGFAVATLIRFAI